MKVVRYEFGNNLVVCASATSTWNGGGVYILSSAARTQLAKTVLSAAARYRNAAAAATVTLYRQLDEARNPEPPKDDLADLRATP
jgi:hypothetical protein